VADWVTLFTPSAYQESSILREREEKKWMIKLKKKKKALLCCAVWRKIANKIEGWHAKRTVGLSKKNSKRIKVLL
jgi:hypothetical protein